MVKPTLSKSSGQFSAKQQSAFVGPKLSGHFVKVTQAVNAIEAIKPGTIAALQEAVITRGGDAVMLGLNKIANNDKIPTSYRMPKADKGPAAMGEDCIFPGVKSPTGNFAYALSGAPEPKKVVLNSGVSPDTFVSDYMPPIENVCSPLHISQITLAVPTSVSNPMSSYFINNVAFNIQSKAQQTSTFLLDVSSSTGFTAANIVAAINDGIYALSVYFYYSSILSYDSDSKNKNSGMDYLRALVDAQTLSDYKQLGKRLEDTPLPPKLVEWVRYMSSNFKSGDNAGSAIIKTAFTPNAITGTRPSVTWPSVALTNLSRNNNLAVWTLMRKALPKWRIGKLYDVPVKPLFDKQFLTIFANLPNVQRASGANVSSGVVANLNTAISYNSYSNHLDGLSFAMSSVHNGTEFVPGLCNVNTVNPTYTDNRYSFYSVAGVQGFYPVHQYPFLGVSRNETFTQLATAAYVPHLSGSDKCQNVTGAALCNSAQEVLDFMFETKTTLKLGVKNTFKH
jgi:hypothetical protein